MNDRKAVAMLANVGEVFKAATLLHKLGLQTEEPAATVRRYVAANPEINEFVSRHPDGAYDAQKHAASYP